MTDPKKLVLVAGRPSHDAGMHEFRAGVRLLAHCLAEVPDLVTQVAEDGVLPDLPRNAVDAVVVYADGGPSHPLHHDDGWARLDDLVRQGAGVGFLHYAVEAPLGRGDQELARWIGGFYEDGYSCNPMFDAHIEPVPDHPISQGVDGFSAVDEWYISVRFAAEGSSSAQPVLVTTPSDAVRRGPYVWPVGPYAHVVAAGGSREPLLWVTERADGGRGLGFTGGHFHRNWQHPTFRRVVLNGLVWVSGLTVPAGGVQSSLAGYDIDDGLGLRTPGRLCMTRLIGANTWIWTSPLTDDNLEESMARVAGMGFDAIELPLENPSDWDARHARAVIDTHALAPVVVAAMGPGRSLVSQAGDVAATLRYLSACIQAAATTGARVVAGPMYTPTGTTWRMSDTERTAVIDELQANLAPLVAEASDHGVTLAVEPLNRYETSLLNTVEQALDALGPLLGEGLGLALDTYHLNIEEKKPVAAIRNAGAAIAHVQVCGNDRGAVGDDHTDWQAIMAALDEAGYDGILGVESFTADNATIAVAASVWRPLARSQDELAERSLAFLRSFGENPNANSR